MEEPHSGICGKNRGQILNLVDKEATATRNAILNIAKEKPEKLLKEIPYMVLPTYCGIKAKDVDLKHLGSILWLAQASETKNFEDLLLLNGIGPRTLYSSTFVSEVIYGTSSRFTDPARFSVPTKVYDETITTLKSAVEKVKLGESDKSEAIKKLTKIDQRAKQDFVPNDKFEELLKKENDNA